MKTSTLQAVISCSIEDEIGYIDNDGYISHELREAKKFMSGWDAILHAIQMKKEWRGSGLLFKVRYVINGTITHEHS